MFINKILVFCLALPFTLYSGWAMWQVGYFGIWQAGFINPGTGQILFDLVVLGLLFCAWMIHNARQTDRNPWPYILITLSAGSFGPLLYLLLTPEDKS